MGTPEQWDGLLSGEITDDEKAQLLTEALDDLDKSLSLGDQTLPHLSAILDRTLGGATDDQTWNIVRDGIAAYAGSNVAYLLSWLGYAFAEERLAEAEEHGSSLSIEALRFLVGSFGAKIRRAMTVRADLLDDWQVIAPYVFEDKLGGGLRLRVELTKTNDERVVIEGTPDSILTLGRFLLVMLCEVPPEAFEAQRLTDFLESDQLLPSLHDQASNLSDTIEGDQTVVATGQLTSS